VATGPFPAWAAAVSTPGVAAVASGSTPAKAAAMRRAVRGVNSLSLSLSLPLSRTGRVVVLAADLNRSVLQASVVVACIVE
jgi:hypothetical protein